MQKYFLNIFRRHVLRILSGQIVNARQLYQNYIKITFMMILIKLCYLKINNHEFKMFYNQSGFF